MRKLQITVIGDSAEIPLNNQIAYDTGRLIAGMGHVLINGGREGVMTASSKGAEEAGGLTVSILPEEDVNAGHAFGQIKIATGLGYTRNSVNVLSADIVVAIGGMSGTLCEIAYAWAFNKPIIAFTTADGWGAKLAGTSIDKRRSDVIIPVSSIEELEREIQALAEKIRRV